MARPAYTWEQRRERFWQRVDKSGPCWIYRGAKLGGGYGAAWDGHNVIVAHRLAWRFERGDVPRDKFVCHTCDNRECVNPDHLYVGTHLDNMRDMRERGRSQNVLVSRMRAKTHCVNGHPLSGENVAVGRNRGVVYRRCRQCRHDAYIASKEAA